MSDLDRALDAVGRIDGAEARARALGVVATTAASSDPSRARQLVVEALTTAQGVDVLAAVAELDVPAALHIADYVADCLGDVGQATD